MFIWSSVIPPMAAINRRGDIIHIAAERKCNRASSAGEWEVPTSTDVWIKTIVIIKLVSPKGYISMPET